MAGALTAIAANAATAQDIAAGEHIATTWCAGCHQVGKEQPGARNDAVPSFVSVAKMSSTTATSLQVFLSTSHGKMPDYSLSRNEIRNVSAYILSLREP
ncbi:MAG TPA: c-type cytochrome [Rhizomicrobium sp.]|nr:c-type cytochrome [Rhizomicrobium sp.]